MYRIKNINLLVACLDSVITMCDFLDSVVQQSPKIYSLVTYSMLTHVLLKNFNSEIYGIVY